MRTASGFNNDILNATMPIQEMIPEWSKYKGAIQVAIPDTDDPEIKAKILKDYSDSLDALFKKYTADHSSNAK